MTLRIIHQSYASYSDLLECNRSKLYSPTTFTVFINGNLQKYCNP